MMEVTTELIEKAKLTKSAEELLELASQYEIKLTEEEAVEYFDQLNPKTGSLSDEELDNVAGGTCYHDNKKVVTALHSCINFKYGPKYASEDCKAYCKNCIFHTMDKYSTFGKNMRMYCRYDQFNGMPGY